MFYAMFLLNKYKFKLLKNRVRIDSGGLDLFAGRPKESVTIP